MCVASCQPTTMPGRPPWTPAPTGSFSSGPLRSNSSTASAPSSPGTHWRRRPARRLLQTYAGRRPPDRERLQLAAHLTEREAAILRALAEGLSNAEIAANLWLSAETVKTHIKNILAKLGVRDRTQAVVWAYRTGFVDPAGRP